MKRAFILAILFLVGSVVAVAEPRPSKHFANPLLNEVVQMSRAGLPDATVVAYVKARRSRLDSDVSAEDLIALRQAGVSDAVVTYIAGAAGVEENASGRSAETTYESSADEGQAYPVEPAYTGDYAYAYGYPYWYAWGYGPWWYGGPFISSTFVVGGRFHGHRSFGHFGHFSGSHGFGHGHGHR